MCLETVNLKKIASSKYGSIMNIFKHVMSSRSTVQVKLNGEVKNFKKEDLLLFNFFKCLHEGDKSLGDKICDLPKKREFTFFHMDLAIKYMKDNSHFNTVSCDDMISFLKCVEYFGK